MNLLIVSIVLLAVIFAAFLLTLFRRLATQSDKEKKRRKITLTCCWQHLFSLEVVRSIYWFK